jgi:DNA polymerase-3 subunit delta
MDGLAFLEKAATAKPQPVYVLHGEEDFVRRQVRLALEARLLDGADPSFAVAGYPGNAADFSAVRTELDTLPFLSPRRIVVIEQADPFVTKYRPQLEKYVAAPSKSGVLILEARTFPATTKLAKSLPESAVIACKAPADAKLPAWCVDWSAARHGKKLAPAAAQLLVDLVGPSLGQLDQELAKLAVAVGAAPAVQAEDVDRLVGRTRAAEVFQIFPAIAEGDARAALAILARLFEEGTDPIQVLSGPFSWQLRRLAQVARLSRQGLSLAAAMDRAGVPNYPAARKNTEQLVRHLGWRRLEKLYDWLLEADFGLKGGSALPPRVLLERLVVRLARPREATK